MVHTTCTFHIKETTPLISCYIDSTVFNINLCLKSANNNNNNDNNNNNNDCNNEWTTLICL